VHHAFGSPSCAAGGYHHCVTIFHLVAFHLDVCMTIEEKGWLDGLKDLVAFWGGQSLV
jgi:hypothetical protein